MKKLYLILLLSLFLIPGCIKDMYVHDWIDKDGIPHKLSLKTDRGMTTTKTGDVFIYLPDGAIFMAGEWAILADPNSALAIGEMVKTGTGGGLLQFLIPGL